MRTKIALVSVALLLVAVSAVALWPDESGPSTPPTDVVLTGEGDDALRETVSAVITRLRQRDVTGLAALDVDLDSHRRGGAKSEAGARWLITHFADPLRGPIQVEIRHDDNAYPLWHACLSYASARKKILLDFNSYGKKGAWPDPNDGGKYSFTAFSYADLVGHEPQIGGVKTGLFCDAGDLFPPSE